MQDFFSMWQLLLHTILFPDLNTGIEPAISVAQAPALAQPRADVTRARRSPAAPPSRVTSSPRVVTGGYDTASGGTVH